MDLLFLGYGDIHEKSDFAKIPSIPSESQISLPTISLSENAQHVVFENECDDLETPTQAQVASEECLAFEPDMNDAPDADPDLAGPKLIGTLTSSAWHLS